MEVVLLNKLHEPSADKIRSDLPVTGDCLAINEKGGYSFFDFFTQYPDMNKKSLVKLKALIDNVQHIQLEYVCTGHSGIRKYSDVIFAHIDESAQFSKRKPFDDKAPYDAFDR